MWHSKILHCLLVAFGVRSLVGANAVASSAGVDITYHDGPVLNKFSALLTPSGQLEARPAWSTSGGITNVYLGVTATKVSFLCEFWTEWPRYIPEVMNVTVHLPVLAIGDLSRHQLQCSVP
jgi:hypothetical protein